MKVYLAGPDVFLPDGAAVGDRKKSICRRYGLVGLFPLDNALIPAAGSSRSQRIFSENMALMNEADAVIANLTPFRGPGADAGTVFELGYMAGCKKLCFGYSNVAGTYAERVAEFFSVRRDQATARLADADGMAVEDFGLADNLMIVEMLASSGHPLITPETPPSDRWRDLAAFETCVRLLSGVDAVGTARRLA
jgi:nucleoside 2-deoxyribosyltransferase